MRASALSLVGLLLGGCSPDGGFLGLPPLASAQSLVLVITDGEGRVAEAIDLTQGSPVRPVELVSRTDSTFEAWLYEADLSSLDLAPGPLQFVGPLEGTPLRAPDAAYSAAYSARALTPWTATPTASVAALALRIPLPDRCIPFVPESFSFGTSIPPTFAVSLQSGEVLLGGPSGGLSLLTRSGVTPLSSPLGAPITGGSLEAGHPVDRLWLRTDSGVLHYGAAELPLRMLRAATATLPPSLDFRAGLMRSGDVEVFVLADDGRLLRQEGQEVTLLHQFTRVPLHVGWIARARERDALAVYAGDSAAVRYLDGTVSRISGRGRPFETLTAALWTDSYLLGTTQGAVLRVEPAGLNVLSQGPNVELFALQPVGGSYIAAGTNGFVAQVDPRSRTFCASIPVGGAAIYRLSLLAGRDPVVIAGGPEVGAQDTRITVLKAE
ncbi:MAG: hypothetical protein IT384_23495 [Deltaproteobacteria bacterium]|nr:hypothetical protein [Deltaproteobacteria bacterium]